MIRELEEPSSGDENLGGSDEDPDEPVDKVITDYRGYDRTVKVDRHGTMITAKTPRKIPFYTNQQWREIGPAMQVVMLKDYDKRQARKRIRGVRGVWTDLTDEQSRSWK